MTTLHLIVTTPVAPQRIISALTDFTPKRVQTWSNIDPRHYAVHAVAATSADVTEGSAFFGGVWEHVQYDWSRPGYITITVISSNTFTSDSFWKYHITSAENGGSRIDLTLHRVGKNLKGFIITTMLRIFGQRIFRKDLEQTLARLAATDPVTNISQEV